MRYGVVGSRRRDSRVDRANIRKFIASLKPDDIVISGGCRGVDSSAVYEARRRGIVTIEHLPDLTGCKKKWEFTNAYYARNKKIAENCDVLVAFVAPDRKGGTENTIKYAQEFGKEIRLL